MLVVLLVGLLIGGCSGFVCGRASRPKPKLVRRKATKYERPIKLDNALKSGWIETADELPVVVGTKKKALNAEENALKREADQKKREKSGDPF